MENIFKTLRNRHIHWAPLPYLIKPALILAAKHKRSTTIIRTKQSGRDNVQEDTGKLNETDIMIKKLNRRCPSGK